MILVGGGEGVRMKVHLYLAVEQYLRDQSLREVTFQQVWKNKITSAVEDVEKLTLSLLMGM